jgi:hypothetical protein
VVQLYITKAIINAANKTKDPFQNKQDKIRTGRKSTHHPILVQCACPESFSGPRYQFQLMVH